MNKPLTEDQKRRAQNVLNRVENGGRITATDQALETAADIVTVQEVTVAAGRGLITGVKAFDNAVIDTAVGFVTLGYVPEVGLIPVDQVDIDNGYAVSYTGQRVAIEFLAGVATGNASSASKTVLLIDVAGNTTSTGRGVYDMVKNKEVNLHNGLQAAGGIAGLTGNTLTVAGRNAGAIDGLDDAAGDVRVFSKGGFAIAKGNPISVKQVKINLGKTGLSADEVEIKYVQGLKDFEGDPVYGMMRISDGNVVRGASGKPLVEVSELGLEFSERAVFTIWHEIHHIRATLGTGQPSTEAHANAFALQMLNKYRAAARAGKVP